MRARACASISLCLVGAGGCMPSAPPDSQLLGYPEVIGLRQEVIEEGPHSVGLLPIPADRTRTEALPGDRVRVTALVANEDGVIDLDRYEPRWILHPQQLRRPFGVSSLSPCGPDDPRLFDLSPCDLGSSATLELTVPELTVPEPTDPELPGPARNVAYWLPQIGMIAGIDVSTDECIDRLLRDPQHVGFECLMAQRSLSLGPLPTLVQRLLDQGATLEELGLDPERAPQLTATEIQPDFAPETPYFALLGPDDARLVWPGDHVEVVAGQTYDLSFGSERRDIQFYAAPFGSSSEFIMRTIHTTAPAWIGRQLVVPEDETSFTLFLVTTDNRESQSWAQFDFDVVPP